ncbi:MAG: DNA polymerase III subunit epsilon, partial [Alphaproteobacteria bacterium]
ALCRRFDIDNTARTLHGALLDAELLAEVYLELIGGRQPGLVLANAPLVASSTREKERIKRLPRPHQPTAEELTAHAEFLGRLKNPVWKK